MRSLQDKVVIVTGGGRGIGEGISLAFAEAGAKVIIAGRNEENNHNVVMKIREHGGAASSIRMDVTKDEEIENAIGEAIKEYGKVDVLVNNSAVDTYEDAIELSLEEWDYVFNVNTRALFRCSQLFARTLIQNKWGGAIINIASNAGKNGFLRQVHYNASKSAVISITQSMSKELAEFGINVNALCPGAVNTEMLRDVMLSTISNSGEKVTIEELKKEWAPQQLGRLIEPIEVGRVVVFLASEDAKIIRGQAINIDAGMTY